MKKILAILIALLAALAVQTVAFADGEMMPLQPASTQSETSSGTAVPVGDTIKVGEINYTVLAVPSGGETGEVKVGRNQDARDNVTIPATITNGENTYTVTSIGDDAFWNCSGLTSVDIPDSVTSIGGFAFYYCTGLTSVDIPGSVTSIGGYAFGGCSNLTEVTIPDSVTSIGIGAFSKCCSLTSVDIPGSVTSIGNFAFYDCTGLTSVDIPDGVTSIGNGAFFRCSGLTSVTIPGSVTSIGGDAFRNCDSLTSITIPGSVTSIGNGAFSYCIDLTSVTIPGSVTTIGEYAFSYCAGLTSVAFTGTTPPTFGSDVFFDCSSLQAVQLSEDLTEEQRAEWKNALNGVMPAGYQIEYKDLTPDPEPTPTPDPTPTTPPADTNTAAEPASAPTVQQMESAERPDPQDVEATERYHFWMGVKADLRAAADGKTLRVHVPADYTNMPASVMEQIRLLDADVTVDLRWNGERLTITPATAQRKTALKAFWTFAQLCELYAQ